ncbi:phenylalanine--tRNA ligase subunit beta [Candidatus Dojkabacteria bacterium]|nr:phenylalanine--tRNA ligase subunit beta [Candidatus Dojkabacteria bacterium]
MKISLNWVKEFTEIKLPPEELKERVSVSLTEAESIENFGDNYKGIIVAKVLEVKDHPESSNLLVLVIDVGKSKKTVVVQKCPVKVGDKVPYLKPGLIVPESAETGDPVKVEKTNIKGVDSEGMIPSGREIGLNYDHTTVYTVPQETKTGSAFEQVMDLVDPILEIKNKALTHRPDTFSVVGIAREVSAIQATKFDPPEWLYNPDLIKPKATKNKYKINLENNAEALCARYTCVVIENVDVKPSPKWMQIRLSKMGIHPVNNIVDISNYLMLEVGQPNHAFDYDKITTKDPGFKDGVNIVIRLAKAGEKITTIDGQLVELYDDTIVIADSANPIGIAGVMGGKDTEISDDTRKVVFQVENLDMYNIRRTSMKTGIFSEAVTRFSKGLDPNLCEPVLYKGIQMIEELSGGTLASQIYDDYKEPVKEHSVSVDPDYLRKRIGADISDKEMKDILHRLCLAVDQDEKSKIFSVRIPTFRKDLNIPEDIAEEIVRIYGYDRLETTLPTRKIHPVSHNKTREKRIRVKDALKSLGANEIYTYAFVGEDLYKKCGLGLEGYYRLVNALSPDLEYMRPVLLPSVLEKVALNFKNRQEVTLFEIDMVHGKKLPKGQLPEEPVHLCLAHSESFYHAKLYLESLLKALNISSWDFEQLGKATPGKMPEWIEYALNSYHPGRTAFVYVEGDLAGIIGQVDFDTTGEMNVPEGTSAFEIRLDGINQYIQDFPDYIEPSRYPSVEHDFCFITDSDVQYKAIREAILGIESKDNLVRSVTCKDIYIDKKNSGKKKTTVTVTMQSNKKTLKEDDIDTLREKIIKNIERAVKGKLDG